MHTAQVVASRHSGPSALLPSSHNMKWLSFLLFLYTCLLIYAFHFVPSALQNSKLFHKKIGGNIGDGLPATPGDIKYTLTQIKNRSAISKFCHDL
jgi:hypothetical protein